MTVWFQGTRGGRSSPHENAESTTIDFGTHAALSRGSQERSAVSSPTM
jgi:hypothetical protein